MATPDSWQGEAERLRRVYQPPPCSCTECDCARPTKGGDDVCTRCLMEEHANFTDPAWDE